MEKYLKFKRQWFEILNQCDSDLRSDVIEAVFQYFFAGIEPLFTDEARKIAFAFIRADVDASEARRQARMAKKEAQNSETVFDEGTVKDIPAKKIVTKPSLKPTCAEAYAMNRIMKVWNSAVQDAEVLPADMSLHYDSPELIPLLHALRNLGEDEITNRIQNTDPDDFVEFDVFFNNLSNATVLRL